jgi:hypothetical protein
LQKEIPQRIPPIKIAFDMVFKVGLKGKSTEK